MNFIAILFFILSGFIQKPEKQSLQEIDPCNIYGAVFIEKNKNRADYYVFVEKSEVFADLTVFKEENRLLADDAGLWFFTDNRDFADFTIYVENAADIADFTIFYTDVVSYAGCD